MKKKFKIILAAIIVIAAATCLCACSQWNTPYDTLDGEGYKVSVRFDVNGGMFAGTNDVYIVDVFNVANAKVNTEGKVELPLLSPEDQRRGMNAFTASKNGCFLAGWYTERTPRVNEKGEPLDEYGQLVSESGREQGYEYSGKWDFSTDKLELDPNGKYTSEENVMTLYAAWIPYFTYEFMAKNEETGEFETIGTESLINLELPAWNENTGKLEMKKFPTVDGKTFLAAYLDEEMTEELTESITGNVDYEKGIGVSGSVKIYTTWREGEWFRIYNAKQFYSNSRPGGCYELMADLDFSAQVWAPTLAKGKFTGIIEGNGHKISNISVIQADISQISGGVFGSLEGARISNVTFENITYTVQSGSRLAGASFGLLCGSANDTSVLENVSVIGGKLLIGDGCYPGDSYSFGLLCGSGGSMGVDLSGITCETQTAGSAKVAVETDAVSGRVTVTFLL